MKINRVAENLKMLDEVSSGVFNPDVARNIILMDISRSLSVIADELTSKEVNHDDTNL